METLHGQKEEQNRFLSGTSKVHQAEHKGRRKGGKKIPAFHTCCHGIKQQQKGPLLPWLNLLRMCPRERSVLWLGQIFFSSRYILFFLSCSAEKGARPPPTPPSLVNASLDAYISFLSVVAVSFTEGKLNCRTAPEALTGMLSSAA